MPRRILASSRFVVAFASLVTLLIYGTLVVAKTIWHLIGDGSITAGGAKQLSVELIEMTDVFLLGAVLDIVALVLFELFVDPELPFPD